jgi:hypothetical protein
MATDYGTDLVCATDLTPTMQTNSGLALMADVCCRRLSTPNQSLLSAPDERTTDLRLYIGSTQARGPSGANTIRSDATAALKADPRIFQVAIGITMAEDASFIELEIDGVGSIGPFQLTLKVSAVRVEVLNAGS